MSPRVLGVQGVKNDPLSNELGMNLLCDVLWMNLFLWACPEALCAQSVAALRPCSAMKSCQSGHLANALMLKPGTVLVAINQSFLLAASWWQVPSFIRHSSACSCLHHCCTIDAQSRLPQKLSEVAFFELPPLHAAGRCQSQL